MPSRTVPEKGQMAHLVPHLEGSTACSICSGSIPLESDGVVVTVTATGATLRTQTRDQSMTNVLNAEKRTPAAVDKNARLHGRASPANSVPSPTRLTSVSPVGVGASREDMGQ